ncbi:hypothetical protein [Methanotorris formicicus]|uniref:Uncharacterized protein n=2 Tax=Methanotorris formicicus TaxID=213185 RepID=H1L0X5_9EURY|nr:hypothetical protein [Methanotorris formicicus]EHP84335.1 hypothetical protein MetfoDRAFT_1699 [Methanotorris formicicus Mc-S-70]
MINNIEDSESFDIKRIGIISIMLWFLFSVLAIPIFFSMLISLFGKTWLYGNNYFIENEVEYFISLISSILAVLLVSYYYSKDKVKILIGYLLKITLVLLILKIALYFVLSYYPMYIPFLGISNGFICYIVFMAMFLKLSELHRKKISFLFKMKMIILSLLIWLAISYPLYWGAYTFITGDYFIYPCDYWDFEKFIFFIYVSGALLSVPLSVILISKLTGLTNLKKYSLELLKYSSMVIIIGLGGFIVFTLYEHHISSIGTIIVLVIFFGLTRVFKILSDEK